MPGQEAAINCPFFTKSVGLKDIASLRRLFFPLVEIEEQVEFTGDSTKQDSEENEVLFIGLRLKKGS